MATPVERTPVERTPADLQGTCDTRTEQSSQLDTMWEVECISLATGSKCLPQGKQSPRGDILNDCHAEVLARRGFNRWCLEEMRKSIEDPHNLRNKFKYSGDRGHDPQQQDRPLFEMVSPSSQFHLYVSQAPCGDATTASLAQVQSEESWNAFMSGQRTRSIATVQEATPDIKDLPETPVTGSKRARGGLDEMLNAASRSAKLQKQDTGSKPNIHKNQSHSNHILGFRRGRIDYDSVGVLRTKPGRIDSEPTLSMSCSDKIARWNILGLNSALVMPFLEKPIYLESIVTRELFDADALDRALFGRIQDCLCTDQAASGSTNSPHRISVHKSEIAFSFSKEIVSERGEQEGITSLPVASASSLSWIASEPQMTEVLVNGCKAGASAKKQIQPKARSRLCKINMFESSIALWKLISPKPPLVKSMTTTDLANL
ncbi:tRNA-specific adenosine deaminase 1 [Linnemannia exigua]|uniref:tRNA-specific adenosine deaminase 1 n=1 Tax=Linnemannia exigua TaxID=604196 RepID=A0AAD4DDS8_9FUNG|nr:tRNA-specific adenosine deaminase 1 [Linnemannia exigua]